MSRSTAVERVAHRGAPREVLENTLASFARALELRADAIELDVHVTSDGVVVVHHDDAVRRRRIATTPWTFLRDMTLRGGHPVPRLQDVFELVGDRATVYVELKGRGATEPAIDVARRFGRRYAMHSFDHAAVERVATIAPDIPRGVLLDRGTRNSVEAMRRAIDRTGARDVWPHRSLVDARFMASAAELGARVIVWTVNMARTARALRDLGVSGICTDDVSLLDNL